MKATKQRKKGGGGNIQRNEEGEEKEGGMIYRTKKEGKNKWRKKSMKRAEEDARDN
jgi:hypothetical protein